MMVLGPLLGECGNSLGSRGLVLLDPGGKRTQTGILLCFSLSSNLSVLIFIVVSLDFLEREREDCHTHTHTKNLFFFSFFSSLFFKVHELYSWATTPG